MLVQFKSEKEIFKRNLKLFLNKHLIKFEIKFAGDIARIYSPQKEEISAILPQVEALDFVKRAEVEIEEICPIVTSVKRKLKGDFMIIAGPCAVENEKDYLEIIKKITKMHIAYVRAPIFKPRRSPYTFQGLGEVGIKIIKKVKEKFRVKLVSEILSSSAIESMSAVCDVLQIGARNMRNYDLLKAVSKIKRTVLLKRAQGASLNEWLMAAEYIAKGGNLDIILCERGDYDLYGSDSGINFNIALKARQSCGLKVIVDVTHSSGGRQYVSNLSRAAAASGLDGIMIEIHEHPHMAIVDGKYALGFGEFKELCNRIKFLTECSKK
jgi:3-deoxy-7-phosphoheptulonate synthase